MLNAEAPSRSRIALPPVPIEFAQDAVAAWSEAVMIDTYLPEMPDGYPAFLDSRVYQGSSGRVYPLPFHERINPERHPHEWQAVHIENAWLRLMIMPELGGRIHIAYDKMADYDIFYRNNVIKPALVGLAGPWIAGGIEFNWPQHHRPGTFLPTDFSIERESDGSITVWCSDHDPFARMKGMHGIRLRPDSAVIEARVRLFNRSEVTQTFLWWANVAAAVGDKYQSFFPTDVTHVADHAKRAITTFPHATDPYYGIEYPARVDSDHPDGDRIDWYRNIPVPTSYMVTATDDEFFGGYDHAKQAGFVHWASRDISPGKKLWTWGNEAFGWAWGSNLTDDDGPYVELMAGVYTDNQPDFSFLAPGETKTFSQFWYPIQEIGPVQQATRLAAANVAVNDHEKGATLTVGLAVTQVFESVTIVVTDAEGQLLLERRTAAAPGKPVILNAPLTSLLNATSLTVRATSGETELVTIRPRSSVGVTPAAQPATEPPAPVDVSTVDELFLVGQYLEQYRHATRSPEPYWEEALRREPGDVRAHVALAARKYAAADFDSAESHLRIALAQQSKWVPNPSDGEAHYRLGLTLVRLDRDGEAEPHFAKAAWTAAWGGAAHYALGRLHARAGAFPEAVDSLRRALSLDPQHLQAADLLVRVLRQVGHADAADALLVETLERDPLDQWALDLAGRELTRDAPTLLDVALDYAGAGFFEDALRLLGIAEERMGEIAIGQVEVGPLVAYHRHVLLRRLSRSTEAIAALEKAHQVDARHCLPSRLEDVITLRIVLDANESDARAAALLGHWYYDRNRRLDAIHFWNQALSAEPDDQTAAVVHRNLGLAGYNVTRDKESAWLHYEAAVAAAPNDAKLWHEYDQLASRMGESSAKRLQRLSVRPDIVRQRDDLTVSFARLLTDNGQAERARDLLSSRQFQPWEGGEGEVILAWDRATLSLARAAMETGNSRRAVDLLESAVLLPSNLGEARHPLANNAEIYLAMGDALVMEDADAARAAWRIAADSEGDFSSMTTRAFSRQSIFSILALRRLGEDSGADQLAEQLGKYVEELARTPARIDYFATSLPTMLLFVDDSQTDRDAEVELLRGMLQRLEQPAANEITASTPLRPTGTDAGRSYREKGSTS